MDTASRFARLTADISAPFRAEGFNARRLPVLVGEIDLSSLDAAPSCLDMLVKLPGDALTLPPPYDADPAIREAFRLLFETEDRVLSSWRESRYLYLTVDRRFVEPGRTHRNAGWHFDGMQGARYPVKLPVCHQYVVSSRNTTEFSDAPVDATDLDEDRDNWFLAIGARVPDDAPVFRPEPGQLMLMSAYQVHRSPVAEEPGWRTFVRIDVSLKQQDRLGNTPNPALPAPWVFVERRLPEGLGVPKASSGWEGASRFGQT